jgi:pyruvyltransferase
LIHAPCFETAWNAAMILLKQFSKHPNAGDVASGVLVANILADQVAVMDAAPLDTPNLVGIGSIMHWADSQSVVWGTGMISPANIPESTPAKVLAVRGPLTRDRMTAAGIPCPDLMGDPGVLVSEMFPAAPRTPSRLLKKSVASAAEA